MGRPKECRMINALPGDYYFKPRGIPLTDLHEVTLGLDEFEAIRLADFEGLYHAEAAKRMGISRATFGRVVSGGRQKIAEALLLGKALKIQGGSVIIKAPTKQPKSKSGKKENVQ
jgi:predicted DNA-binding protein (UPF0251 family)